MKEWHEVKVLKWESIWRPSCLLPQNLLHTWSPRFGHFWVDLGAEKFTGHSNQYSKLAVEIRENFVEK